MDPLLRRCLPPLTRWAHGRLPAAARHSLDTGDIVQDAILQFLHRLEYFEPRHVGSVQAYLKRSIINRVYDEARKAGRQPQTEPITPDYPEEAPNPLETAIGEENYRRYGEALTWLKPAERRLVIGRIEMQWTYPEIAERLGKPSPDAARMAVTRALQHLTDRLRESGGSDGAGSGGPRKPNTAAPS